MTPAHFFFIFPKKAMAQKEVITEVPENSTHPESRAAWRAWLEKHHTRAEGVWLISYKRSTGKPRVTYDESVEEGLCFGWIDSKQATLDDERSMLWFSPRKAGTGWARTNKARVEKLTEAGLMAPAGQAKVDAARQDGSWNALDAVEALEVPQDLADALASHPPARQYFDAFPPSVRKGILGWIASAKRDETRAKRVEETARLASENIRANQ